MNFETLFTTAPMQPAQPSLNEKYTHTVQSLTTGGATA